MAEFLSLPLPEAQTGLNIDGLSVPKAKAFALAIQNGRLTELVDCTQITGADNQFFGQGDEIIIFDLSLQVGQRPVNDIRYIERIAVHFDSEDRNIPWVYALRNDFPKVLHRNSLHFDQPQCLCIYENSYDELRVEWRAIKFIADIRRWLELTADDKLHQDDQPLEPFLVSNMGTIIVPQDYRADETLHIYAIARKANKLSLLASRVELEFREPYQAQAILLKGMPQSHGVVGKTPTNLTDLHLMLLPAEIDLFKAIKDFLQKVPKTKEGLEKRLIIFLELPKTGTHTAMNQNDYYVFLTAENADQIGFQLDLLAKNPDNGEIGIVLGATDIRKGEVLGVAALLPQLQITPDWALILSGNLKESEHRETRIFQIGTGALGSQFFMNQARSGFGRWVLTDHDFMMPHNMVRHALDMAYMGNFKSLSLAAIVNQMYEGGNFVTALGENYLYPEQPEEFSEYLMTANVILDVSTSIAVARHLAARTDTAARRISIFLSPNGFDLVILAEDNFRKIPLDILEFQYYQYLIDNMALSEHLKTETGIRLSISCRDVTARIPQEAVAILAGVAGHQFRKILRSEDAFIGVWHIDESTSSLTPHFFEPEEGDVWDIEGWTIFVSKSLVEKIVDARLSKLPNETGGILIGGYDFERKKVYLTDTILSPSDSEEYPTAYIRGTDGVEASLSNYREKTADHLKYAGEWHSHPVGCSLNPSNDDKILFKHIFDEMIAIGFPTLMIIAGDDKKYQIYFQPNN